MKVTSTFTNDLGVPFMAVLVEPGEFYGNLSHCLAQRTTPPVADRPMVEFYDRRYPHTQFGQFVSRYLLETLTSGDAGHLYGIGLVLDGGIPDWQVSAENMRQVRSELYPD